MSWSYPSISFKEAQQIKGIARKAEPPPRAEDSVQETTVDASSAWGNARQRLSRLVRAAARERALSLAGPKSKKPSFCPLDQAVVALTSTVKTQALRIGLASGASPPPDSLFEVFFFELDVDGVAEIDVRRVKVFTDDLEDARHTEDGQWVGVDAFIKRCTRLQSLFGQGIETLRRDELETLALQVADYDHSRSGAVLSANTLVGFLSCATAEDGRRSSSSGGGGSGGGGLSQRHRSLQRRERRSILHTLRLRLDSDEVASDVAAFKDSLADKEAASGKEVDAGKLHRYVHKRVGLDLSECEVLALMRDIRADSRGGGGGGSSNNGGGSTVVTRASLEAFVLNGDSSEANKNKASSSSSSSSRATDNATAHINNSSSSERVIIDIQVSNTPPRSPRGYSYRAASVEPRHNHHHHQSSQRNHRSSSNARGGSVATRGRGGRRNGTSAHSKTEDATHAGIVVAAGGLLAAPAPVYVWYLKGLRAEHNDSNSGGGSSFSAMEADHDEDSDNSDAGSEDGEEEEDDDDEEGATGGKGGARRRQQRLVARRNNNNSSSSKTNKSNQLVNPGTTRLSPIIDVRVEEEKVSTDLVAAGYTLAGAVGKGGPRALHLWVRRARSRVEARDFALTDLAFTAGDMKRMEDDMHLPPPSPVSPSGSSSSHYNHNHRHRRAEPSSSSVATGSDSVEGEAPPQSSSPSRAVSHHHHHHRRSSGARSGGGWVEVCGRTRQSAPLVRHMGKPLKKLAAALEQGPTHGDGGGDGKKGRRRRNYDDEEEEDDEEDDEEEDVADEDNDEDGEDDDEDDDDVVSSSRWNKKAQRVVKLRAPLAGMRDLKLWCRRLSADSSSSPSSFASTGGGPVPVDTLSLSLGKWGPSQKKRELEDSVRRALRQLSPSMLIDGPHAMRLDCPVDLNRLFNERAAGTGGAPPPSSVSSSSGHATSSSRGSGSDRGGGGGGASSSSSSSASAAAAAAAGLGSLKESAWTKLLDSAGLSVDPADALTLFRRLAASGDAAKTAAMVSAGASAAKAAAKAAGSTKTLAVLRAPFVAFVSRTDDEVDHIAEQLRLELRRRFGVSRHVAADLKARQADGLESALGKVARASTRGLTPDHLGFLLACSPLLECGSNCHLSRQELWRLCKRFDPRFRGTVSLKRLMEFVTRDHDHDASDGVWGGELGYMAGGGKVGSMALEGEGGHLERVLGALEALQEMVEEHLGRPGISTAEHAASQVWRALCHIHFQRLGKSVKLKQPAASGGNSGGLGVGALLLGCVGDGSGGGADASTYGRVLLEDDDLAVCVEGRMIGQQRAFANGGGDGLRLSHAESTQLVFLLAPNNQHGKVGRREFVEYFASAVAASSSSLNFYHHAPPPFSSASSRRGGGGGSGGGGVRHLVVRSFPALLDELSGDLYLGPLLEAYGKWVKCAAKAVKQQRLAGSVEESEWKAHKAVVEGLELEASSLQREYARQRDAKIEDVLLKLANSNNGGNNGSGGNGVGGGGGSSFSFSSSSSSSGLRMTKRQQRFYAAAATRASVGDPTARLADMSRVAWASNKRVSPAEEGSDEEEEEEGEGEKKKKKKTASSSSSNQKELKESEADEGTVVEGQQQQEAEAVVAAPFRSANELALVVLHCAAHGFNDLDGNGGGGVGTGGGGFGSPGRGGSGGGGGGFDGDDGSSDEEDLMAVPPPPRRRLGRRRRSSSTGRDGQYDDEPGGGVHLVRLRSLVEGLCWVKHGAAPLVVPTATAGRPLLPPPKKKAAEPSSSSSSGGGGSSKADAPPSPSPSSSATSKATDANLDLLPSVRLALGDSHSEQFLSNVVRQLAKAQKDRKETSRGLDGWLGGVGAGCVSLLQSFAHPTVDPWPSRGVVTTRDFRKALALSGVSVSVDEVEDASGPFLADSNTHRGGSGGGGGSSGNSLVDGDNASGAGGGGVVRFHYQQRVPLIDYERFLFMLRRAWLSEWSKDGGGGDERDELKDVRRLLELLRQHYLKLGKVLVPVDLINKDSAKAASSEVLAGEEAEALVVEMRRWYKMAAESSEGGVGYYGSSAGASSSSQQQRLSPDDLVECVRAATEEVRFKAHERARALLGSSSSSESQLSVGLDAEKVSWGGDDEGLPLVGGRARRLLRRLFDFFDDEGDGRCEASELHALLAHGVVGDLAEERRQKLAEVSMSMGNTSMLNSLAFAPLSMRRGKMGGGGLFGGLGEDEDEFGFDDGGDGGDDDNEGDWILMGGLASRDTPSSRLFGHNQRGGGCGGGRRSGLGGPGGGGGRMPYGTPPPNAADEKDVKAHPSMALLAQAVDSRWGADKDRAALKQYLERHVRRDGCLGERKFLKFLATSGLARDLSRRDLAQLLGVLDPTRSKSVPLQLLLDCAVKPVEKEKDDKEAEEKKKKEKEAKAKQEKIDKALRVREIERITRHIFDVCTEYESLPGTGGLRPAFRQFDPRNKGVVSKSVAADVLAYLGCNLIQEECDLLWGALGLLASDDAVDYEQLDALVGAKQQAVAVETPVLKAHHMMHAQFAGGGCGGGEMSTAITGSSMGGNGGGGGGGGLNYSRIGNQQTPRNNINQQQHQQFSPHVTFEGSAAARAYFNGRGGPPTTIGKNNASSSSFLFGGCGCGGGGGGADVSTSFNTFGLGESSMLAGHNPQQQLQQQNYDQQEREEAAEKRMDHEVLVKLAQRIHAAGLAEAKSWGQPSFDFCRFVQLKLGGGMMGRGGGGGGRQMVADGVCSLEDLAAALAHLDVSLGVAEGNGLARRFGDVDALRQQVVVDFKALSLFVNAMGPSKEGDDENEHHPNNNKLGGRRSNDENDYAPRQRQTQQHHQGGGGPVQSLLRLIGPTLVAQQRLGLDVGMTFEMFDPKDTGLVDVESFVEAMRQLDLRLGMEQLQLLVEAFAAAPVEGGGRNTGNEEVTAFVAYRSFVEAALNTTTAATTLGVGSTQRGGGGGFGSSLGDGGSATTPAAHHHFRHSSYTPMRPDPYAHHHQPVSSSWDPQQHTRGRGGGVGGGGGLAPPPLSLSPTRRGRGDMRRDSTHFNLHPTQLQRTGSVSSPTREAAVAIWGATTPLQQKGKIPSRFQEQLSEAGCWMCLTCLFADNGKNSSKCEVCGTANPAAKGSTVHLECTSCHFQNSAFASTCDMCNRQLAGGTKTRNGGGGEGGGRGGDSGGRGGGGSRSSRWQGPSDEEEGSGWKD